MIVLLMLPAPCALGLVVSKTNSRLERKKRKRSVMWEVHLLAMRGVDRERCLEEER
jgi:hypothetical protein